MASRYKFSEAEIAQIRQARAISKNNCAQLRLQALELRATGVSLQEVSDITGFRIGSITALVRKYRRNGIGALAENHYCGNRRNMSIEEEAEILKPFWERVQKGESVSTKEIAAAYQEKVDHPVADTQIYYVLHRHGWKKGMLHAKHA